MNSTTLDSIIRYIPVTPDLAIAGQPTEEQLSTVAAAGFQVVINLALHDDPRYALKDEAATVAALGMTYIHIPVQFSSPTAMDLAEFFNAMEKSGKRKTLVHCAHNKRVPVFIALYRIAKLGWSEAEALAAMSAIWQPDEVWQNFIAQALGHDHRKFTAT